MPTDAPWHIDEVNTPNGVGYFINHLWTDDDGDTHTDEIAEVVMDYRGKTSLENARLLAAAPELLACLKSWVECTDPIMRVANSRRAIAKAEGR